MKKKLLLLTLSIFCLAALLGTFFVVNADETPATAISVHNLALDDSVQIIYYVDQTAPEGAEVGVLCWFDPQENYTLENAQYKLVQGGTQVLGDKEYAKYYFNKVAAKMMTVDVYAVSYVKVGDTVTYSSLDKYSVLQYCFNKKDSTTIMGEGGTTLGELVAGILDYGTIAQTYFRFDLDRLANANYYEISAVDGTLADGTKSGLFQAGEQLTLTAPAEKDGIPFSAWKDETGATIGTERNLPVTVGTKDKTYTAVYETNSNGPKLIVENKSANAGATGVKVAVSIENNPGFQTLALDIIYDESALTLTKVAKGSVLKVLDDDDNFVYTFTSPKNMASGCRTSCFATDMPEEIIDGELIILTFTVKGTATSGTYNITISDTGDGSNPFPIATATGHFTVN